MPAATVPATTVPAATPTAQPPPGQTTIPPFATTVLTWFDQHGRKDLPWQRQITPYRVWVSEVMLQQTQVATVIPYYQRFMQQLPSIDALAQATEDQVLHLWTGLGYYSRARNLRRSAQRVVKERGGVMPDTLEGLQALPGIGRSTAGAILSIAQQRPAAILDGNVKRVLARYHAVDGWPGRSTVSNQLWQYAEAHTPAARVHLYTQAIMDLGATVCTRSQPNCAACPLASGCAAQQRGETDRYPGKKPRGVLPCKHARMLIIENQHGEVLLRKRPPTGVWSSLWLFPELTRDDDVEQFCREELTAEVLATAPWARFRHSFSHYHLDIDPIHLRVDINPSVVTEPERDIWYNCRVPPDIGLAAPVVKLLGQLRRDRKQTILAI